MARHATEEEEEEKAFADRTGEMRLCQSQTEGSGRLLLGFNLEQGLTWSSSYLLFGSGLDYHSGNTSSFAVSQTHWDIHCTVQL